MTSRLKLVGTLVGLGAAWGLTQPLTKITVATGHQPFGLIFWQLVVVSLFMAAIQLALGKSFGLARRHLDLYVAIAVLGTVFPNFISYRSAVFLPAGVMAIIIAIVPMFAVPVAIGFGLEKPNLVRMAGIFAGGLAIILLIGPQAGLPPGIGPWVILVALFAPMSYAFEGNFLAWRGTSGLDPVQVLLGSSLVGIVLVLPLVWVTDAWVDVFRPWDAALYALLASSILHGIAYSGYVWMVGQAGSVFAAQVSYLVTATGVCWAILILGESYSGWVWGAFAMMMAGIALVRPIAPSSSSGQAVT